MTCYEQWRRAFPHWKLLTDEQWALVLQSFPYDTNQYPPERESYALTPDGKVCIISDSLYAYLLVHATNALNGTTK